MRTRIRRPPPAPRRSVRVPDPEWRLIEAVAAMRETYASTAMRELAVEAARRELATQGAED